MGETITGCARLVGITESTAHSYLKTNPAVMARLEAARAQKVKHLAMNLYDQALNGRDGYLKLKVLALLSPSFKQSEQTNNVQINLNSLAVDYLRERGLGNGQA